MNESDVSPQVRAIIRQKPKAIVIEESPNDSSSNFEKTPKKYIKIEKEKIKNVKKEK